MSYFGFIGWCLAAILFILYLEAAGDYLDAPTADKKEPKP